MKIYTEKQVNEIFNRVKMITDEHKHENIINHLTKGLTPIELPSDEDIQEKSKYWNETTNPNMFTFKLAWENGAIRLKKQILNQNK